MCRLLLALLVAALIFPLLNCGGSAHAPDEKYFLVATNVKLPYWQQAGAGLTKAALQMKVQAEMVGPDTYDPKAESEQFQKALAKKPAGILVSVADATVLKGDIDAAAAQGVPVIAIDSDAAGSKRLMFVGTDNHKAGMMGAKVVAEKLKGKGTVAVFTIAGQSNLEERLHGYKDAFDAYPGIKITDTIDVKGDPRIAFDKTTELADKGAKADAYVCLEAVACPEVAEVLERKNVTGKIIVAMDTDQRTLEAIQKGTITATIGQKPYTMAFMGIKLADDLHHNPLPAGKDWSQDSFSPIPTFVDTGASLIDKSNVDQFIQARNSATGK
ncbi:MAG: substrate-binding domain-containing protein [Acidobacteria bacterium]|nr:substrate-binding domain-containing protein [Acidobacteriota bacterium]